MLNPPKSNLLPLAMVLSTIAIFLIASHCQWTTVGMKIPIKVGGRQNIDLHKQESKFQVKGLRLAKNAVRDEKQEFLVVFVKIPEKIDELLLGRKRQGLVGGKRDNRIAQFLVYNEAPMYCLTDSSIYKQLKSCPIVITKY